MTDMSPAQRLTEHLVGQLAALPQVEALALGGSRGSGAADEQSDIDLYVYTRAEIPLAERRAIVARTGGASRANLGYDFWGPGDMWFDAATGIELDLIFFDAGWMEGQLRRVIEQHQASPGYTTAFWRTVRQSQPLFDRGGWLAALQQLARADYPEPLRRNIIALNQPVLRNVIPSYLHQIEKAARRHDPVSLNHRIAALLASYFDVIFALNRVLHPGEKRLIAFATGECPLLPAAMADDLQALLAHAASDQAVGLVERLLDRLDTLLESQGFDSRAGLPGPEGRQMRKRTIGQDDANRTPDTGGWLDIEQIAQVEISSEDQGHPIEAALQPDGTGWQAGRPGPQTIRLLFDAPQTIRRIRLVFQETQRPRTQEFTLGWSADGGQSYREIVRQQYTFSPPGTTRQVEEYNVEIAGATALELRIVPEIGGGEALASLVELSIG